MDKHNEINHKEEILKHVNSETTIPAKLDDKYVCLVCYQAYKPTQEGWMLNHYARGSHNCCKENQVKMLKSIIETKKTQPTMDKFVIIKPVEAPSKPVVAAPPEKMPVDLMDFYKLTLDIQSKIMKANTTVTNYNEAGKNVKDAYKTIMDDALKTLQVEFDGLYKKGKDILENVSPTNKPNVKKQVRSNPGTNCRITD
jgi:hypothetical protein